MTELSKLAVAAADVFGRTLWASLWLISAIALGAVCLAPFVLVIWLIRVLP